MVDLKEASTRELLDEAMARSKTLVVAYVDKEGDLRCCWTGKLGDINWLIDRTKHRLLERVESMDRDEDEGESAERD